MTSSEDSHNSLPDLDPKDVQTIFTMRLSGKIRDERYVRMVGMQDAVAAEELYLKELKAIFAAGRAAGLEIEKRTRVRADDLQAPIWAQAIALMHPAGTPDNERIRAFMGLPSLKKEAVGENAGISDLEEMAPGGIGFQISLAPAQDRINEAVASLGSRKGDRAQDIVADLTEALHARDLDLPAEDLQGIAAELARGEEVIVQVVTEDSGDGQAGGRW